MMKQTTSARGDTGQPPSLMEMATQEVLAVTHWFEPASRSGPYPVTVRFVGERTDAVGRLGPGDRFVWDEHVAEVVPGSGPIAVTARVEGINPGAWRVTAHALPSGAPAQGRRARRHGVRVEAQAATGSGGEQTRSPLLARLWRRWTPHAASVPPTPPPAPSQDGAAPIHTCPRPFALAPGAVPFAWATFVTLGMVVALITQSLLAPRLHLDTRWMLGTSVVAIVAGIVGAKSWFIFKHRDERRIEGWCIQGFVVGASLTGLLLFAALGLSATTAIDAVAPGLLFGMAIGRVGCFFAGCCGGPPTASWWGVWSSDQRVGARRVPTQLLESALALGLGAVALAVIVGHAPGSGAHFVAALAAYTLGRQGILRLRAEPSGTRWAIPATALASGLALTLAIGAITLA